jgi:hypothetical protein
MHVMAERDLNTSDVRLQKTVMKRINSCMWHYRNKGAVQSAPGPGRKDAVESDLIAAAIGARLREINR